jgi:hypothetical protein
LTRAKERTDDDDWSDCSDLGDTDLDPESTGLGDETQAKSEGSLATAARDLATSADDATSVASERFNNALRVLYEAFPSDKEEIE